jgi:hypothetical protein
MQTNAISPAYPIAPMQDNFGRMVVPIAGVSKLEHFALEIFKARLSNNLVDHDIELMNISIDNAILLLNKIEEKHKNISNEKDTVLDIIQ